tara:strand:+ start:180 stop:365 length:186 start_codon:yes stop_codon:yes gene_type:complete
MENKTYKSLDSLKVLQALISQMEKKQSTNPEYIIRNIELTDKIINILNDFKNGLMQKLTTC